MQRKLGHKSLFSVYCKKCRSNDRILEILLFLDLIGFLLRFLNHGLIWHVHHQFWTQCTVYFYSCMFKTIHLSKIWKHSNVFVKSMPRMSWNSSKKKHLYFQASLWDLEIKLTVRTCYSIASCLGTYLVGLSYTSQSQDPCHQTDSYCYRSFAIFPLYQNFCATCTSLSRETLAGRLSTTTTRYILNSMSFQQSSVTQFSWQT